MVLFVHSPSIPCGHYEPPPTTLRSGEERDGKNKVSVLGEFTLEVGSRHKLCAGGRAASATLQRPGKTSCRSDARSSRGSGKDMPLGFDSQRSLLESGDGRMVCCLFQLDTSEVIREEGILTERMPPSDCPVGKSVGCFLD